MLLSRLIAFIAIFAAFLAFSVRAEEVRIGILGDMHGDVAIMDSVLAQMRAAGVTHIIGMGDFVGHHKSDAVELDEILRRVAPLSGVPKERTYLMPGNWELGFGVLDVLARYGHVAFTDDRDSAVFDVAGTKIMVSHYPQFSAPYRECHWKEPEIARYLEAEKIDKDYDIYIGADQALRDFYRRYPEFDSNPKRYTYTYGYGSDSSCKDSFKRW